MTGIQRSLEITRSPHYPALQRLKGIFCLSRTKSRFRSLDIDTVPSFSSYQGLYGCVTGLSRSCICSKVVFRYFCSLRVWVELLHLLSSAGPYQRTLSCRMVEPLAGEIGIQSEYSPRLVSSQHEIRYTIFVDYNATRLISYLM